MLPASVTENGHWARFYRAHRLASLRLTKPFGALSSLRALIPSWRFFDDAGPVLTLCVRGGSQAAPGPWMHAMPREPLRVYSIFFSPGGNARLALMSLVERAIDEDDNGVALEVVEHACLTLAHDARFFASPPSALQYEITSTEPDGTTETLVLSRWITVGA